MRKNDNSISLEFIGSGRTPDSAPFVVVWNRSDGEKGHFSWSPTEEWMTTADWDPDFDLEVACGELDDKLLIHEFPLRGYPRPVDNEGSFTPQKAAKVLEALIGDRQVYVSDVEGQTNLYRRLCAAGGVVPKTEFDFDKRGVWQ